MVTNKAVFLDRDGTIVIEVNYCRHPEDIKLYPKAPQAIKMLNESGFKVILVTNQSGIARGYFNEDTLSQIHAKMLSDLSAHGAGIDAIYYCPHHPDDGCNCRKPQPGNLLQAAEDWDIDCRASFVIGDRLMDIELARNTDCRSVLVTNTRGLRELKNSDAQPDFIAHDIGEAAEWVVSNSHGKLSE
ncbi:D-glycero-beta-D-manno-heptose 1,7-bisphosphate 7-phosphatase [Chloroflexota bacterium]